jgi:hypothetical protein
MAVVHHVKHPATSSAMAKLLIDRFWQTSGDG